MSDKSDPVTLRGTVTRTFASGPEFSAGKLRPAPGQSLAAEVSFAGKVFVTQGELVTLQGVWKDHERFGRQFAVSARLYEESLDAAGLAAWLAHHASAIGIGPMKAARIAEEYGTNFAAVLRDDPEQVAIAHRLKLADVKKLADAWQEHDEENRVGCKLAAYGLTHSQVSGLYQKYKGALVSLLESDPYSILGHVQGFGFRRIDEIARKLGISETHPGRLQAALCYVLGEAASGDGSTCLEHRDLVESAVEVLALNRDDAIPLVTAALVALVEDSKRVRCITKDCGDILVALRWNYLCEQGIAAFLADAAGSRNPHFTEEESSPDAVAMACPHLDPSQVEAVSLAMRNRVVLITGGAGAGKSTIIAALASLYRARDTSREVEFHSADDIDKLDPDYVRPPARVRLAAPTGKAARRLAEVTANQFEGVTIHRLLGYNPKLGGFQHHATNPLPADVIIIDEMSMADAELTCYLLSAIDTNTALVLVGDPNQLPPVGAGAPFRDMIAHGLIPIATLGHCHRQAGALKQNCAAVLSGDVAPTVMNPDGSLGPWVVSRKLHRPEDVVATVEKLFKEQITGRLGFDPVVDVQFLSPQHGGPLGCRAINILLQRLRQATLGVTVEETEGEKRPKLYIGDRVIQTRNNYTLDVMNGHQGVVLNVDPLIVQFDQRPVQIPSDCKGEVELAYCLTVHKVQGSEFPCVVAVVHGKHKFMLHRSLIYTAVTRARACCVVLGDSDGIRHATETVKTDERLTLLPLLAKRLGVNVTG